jgi:hypothetical protein
MKAILTLMTIAIVMASIGMVAAAIPDEDGTLLIGLTTQEYVDYYGMLYLEGDRSQRTIRTLEIFAEQYGVYPSMDIYATATATVTEVTVVPEPVQTPVVVPEPTVALVKDTPIPEIADPVEDDDDNVTTFFVVGMLIIAGIIMYIYSRQDKKE